METGTVSGAATDRLDALALPPGYRLAYGGQATPHVLIFDKERKLRYQGRLDDSRYAEARAIFKERNPAAKKRWFVKDHWERRWVSAEAYAAANPKK